MARVKIEKLLPDTDYVVQVRSVRNGENSRWSEKFNFTTIDKDGKPAAPTTTWEAVGDAFVGTWTPVTEDENGDDTRIVSYELEFGDLVGNTVIVSKVAQTGANMTYTLSYEENTQMFYTARGTVTFRVRAVSNKGRKGEWSDLKTASNEAPTAVTGFTATAISEGVELTWNANTESDIVGYYVYASTTEGFEPSGANQIFFGNTTRFTYNTSTFAEHYFVIKAADKMGQLSEPATASATPISPFLVDITPPDVPTGLTATIVNDPNGVDATAEVSWSMDTPPEDLAGFWLRYRKVGNTSWFVIPQQKDVRSTVVELPEAYQDYEFQIRASDSWANDSDWSATYTATSPVNTPPSDVTGLVSVAGNDSITYYWNDTGDSDIKNYELTFSTSSSFASNNTTFKTGSATTVTVGGLDYETTYYARVRAVDTQGLASDQWSATDTRTTGVVPSSSDGVVPGVPSAPAVTGGFAYLYVSWEPVALNASGGTQGDIVTYEVHLGTTAGFTPAAGTLVTQVSGTSALIDNLPGTTTPLSYDTDYYVKLKAKDRDGVQATVSAASAAAQISKVASGDVTSIGADLIVPGTGFASALVINTGGSIQSSNYNGTAGWKISPTGAEFLDDGSTIKADAIKAGTLGGSSGSGVINIAAGTSLIFNGGYMKSNTYTGTTQATNPSGAGFYMGNDGIRIDQGIVSASALTAGTISGTKTITLSGANAKIVGTGFELSGSGLTVTSGTIAAAALTITSAFADNVTATTTTIDGGKIKTGAIQSQSTIVVNGVTVPKWSINLEGYASFAGAQILGNTVLGNGVGDTSSYIQSSNYNPGTIGWKIVANGDAIFGQVQAGSTAKVEIGNYTVSGIATNRGMVKFGTPSVYQPGVILGGNFGSTYSELRLQGPYSSSPTQAARLILMEYSGVSRAQLYGEQVTISGNSFILDSSDSSSYNFKLVGTSGVTWLDASSNRIRFNLGTGTNTITSANSSNTAATLRINANKINFDVNGGDLEMQGGSNIGGRLGRNSTGGAIVFQAGYLVAGVYTYNGSSPSLSNTVDMYAKAFRSQDGLFDATKTTPGTAAWNNSGRLILSGSSLRFKKYVNDLTLEQASKALDLRPVSFVWKAEMDMGDERVPGFIAEEAAEAGMEMWVQYDQEGLPVGFRYAELTAAHNMLVKDLYEQKEALEATVQSQEERLATLEATVASMQGA